MLIPTMQERPEKRTVICAGAYWMLAFFIVPILLLYMTLGYHNASAVLAWVQIGYYIVNAVCTVFIFREHLADGWFYVRMEFRKFALTILMCTGITLTLYAVLGILAIPLGFLMPGIPLGIEGFFAAFPVSELELFLMPADLLREHTAAAIPVLTLATPVTVSCLLYGVGFAPACEKHVWLGYAVGIGVLILHRSLNYCTVGTSQLETVMFFLQLPAHLGGFVAYHRTNSIWAPIIFHAVNNLLVCLLALLFLRY